jgi:hypothetical protein
MSLLTETRGSGRGAGFMKKRTSKSASGTQGTSSQSGTSLPTDDTAEAELDDPMTDGITRTLRKIVEEVKQMTPEEFRQSLFRSGIIDENGKLTPMYRRRK